MPKYSGICYFYVGNEHRVKLKVQRKRGILSLSKCGNRGVFLPPANEVLGKVMFLLKCVILFTGAGERRLAAWHQIPSGGLCFWLHIPTDCMYKIYDFDLYHRQLENEEKQNGNVISTLI